MMRSAKKLGYALTLALLSLSLVGCAQGCKSSRPPIHVNPNMDWQPRYEAQEASEFFYNGATMRTPVAGTVARGWLREDTRLHTGKDAAGEYLAESPLASTDELAARGAARYAIFCQPCHSEIGDGDGIITKYGGVPVVSYHEERILNMPDGEIFETITQGKGLMSGYAHVIPAEDRWAIIQHIRGLQEEVAEWW